jgi:hypothetical protein
VNVATALIRVGYLLDRYAGCNSQVLRVMSAMDLEAVEVLADIVRSQGASRERATPPVPTGQGSLFDDTEAL